MFSAFNIIKNEVFMGQQINFSHKTLLDLKFEPSKKGYDALQVDKTLDEIISDYSFYEQYYRETREYIEKIETDIKTLKDEKHSMEVELAKYRSKFELVVDEPNANANNIEYLRRIRLLEQALYRKGVDPNKIK